MCRALDGGRLGPVIVSLMSEALRAASAATSRGPLTVKAGHWLMRDVNRGLVVDALQGGGRLSRADIGRKTGLSRPTVSAIVDSLLADGLILEVGAGKPQLKGGRPGILLEYNRDARAYLGIHLGVHHTHLAVADALGRIVVRDSVTSVRRDFELAVSALSAQVKRALLAASLPYSRLAAAGVAVPGLVTEDGRLELAPNLGWREVPIRKAIQRALRVATKVRNIKDAAALAEGHSGVAAGYRNYVWVYAGTGVSAGVVIDGKLLSGTSGFAGEIGHCPAVDDGPRCNCGKRGCIEVMANTASIEAAARSAVKAGRATSLPTRGRLDANAVAAAAEAGDRVAGEILGTAGEHLGRGVAYLVNVLDPELVVVGGPLISSSDSAYEQGIRRSLRRHVLGGYHVPLLTSSLGPTAPLEGAVQVAMALGGRPRTTR